MNAASVDEPLHQVADTVARFIRAAGVPRVYGYPGDPNVELIEALRRAGVDFVLARREATAAFMAEADGLLSGRPGVAVSTLGPGSTALVNGVANAFLDRAPMIAISGQVAAFQEGLLTHQVIDHGRLFAPITKYATRVDPRSVEATLRKAHRMATAERPGPVHLTTSSEALAAEAHGFAEVPPHRPAAAVATVHGGEADAVIRALEASRRPVALVGPAVVRAAATPPLRRLIEKLGVPVVVSPMAKGAVDELHPYFAGTLDMACGAVLGDLVESSDLIVAIGFDPAELIKPFPSGIPVLHIDAIENTDQVYAASLEVVGAISGVLDWLTDSVADGARWSEAQVKTIRTRVHDGMRAGAIKGRLNPSEVLDALVDATPESAIVTTDVGSHKLLIGQGWPSRIPRRFLVSNGLSAMGFALPAGIAARLLHPELPVIVTVGDGGFAMVQGELQVASSLGLDLLVVVLVDGSLNRIELKQLARGYASIGTRLEPGDITAIAGGMGCDTAVATNAGELERALSAPRSASRPLVIEARIDPTQYQAQFS